jgi:phosphinothricin acetyltransferase
MMTEHDISIRIATEADVSELLAIYAPYVEETAITFEYEVPSEQAFANRMRSTLLKYPYLVAQCQGEIAAYAYAGPFKERAAYDWSVETSIYVKKDYRQLGIGRRLYEALEQRLKQQGILNVNACIAYSDVEDEYLTKDSVLFHQKMGYQLVGRFHSCGYKYGRWYDMVWMEKMIGEHFAQQPPVKWHDYAKEC